MRVWVLFGCTIALCSSIASVSSMPLEFTKLGNLRFIPPPPPPGDAPAGRARGGASRGDCGQVQPQLTALAPIATTTQQKASVWGLTTEAYPTVWVYVPYTRNLAKPVEFVLQDASGKTVYKSAIVLNYQPGITGISIPKTVDPMLVGQRYRWYFNVFCDDEKQLPPVSVSGSIQRVALNPTLTKQLGNMTPQQRVELYAAQGIWYDALTTLARLNQSNPQDASIDQAWKNLLRSAGFGDVVEASPTTSAKDKLESQIEQESEQ